MEGSSRLKRGADGSTLPEDDPGTTGRGIGVAVIARHALLRNALDCLLRGCDGIRVAATLPYPRADATPPLPEGVKVVIVMVSAGEPQWPALVERLLHRPGALKVILLSVYNDPAQVQAALSHGVQGYVWYDDELKDLCYALRSVIEGGQFISPSLSAGLLALRGIGAEGGALTRREGQVLRLIADGCTNKEIAQRLVVSVKTVDTHRTRIMRKLDLHNTAALVRFALQEGIVQVAKG